MFNCDSDKFYDNDPAEQDENLLKISNVLANCCNYSVSSLNRAIAQLGSLRLTHLNHHLTKNLTPSPNFLLTS